MTFETFGAGCFGAVIGFVAWHVVRAGEGSFDVKQLAALVGALLGAVVLSAFPAGTLLLLPIHPVWRSASFSSRRLGSLRLFCRLSARF